MPNAEYGVHVDGEDNVIGAPPVADRNLISGNGFGGVRRPQGRGNLVEGSYLGTTRGHVRLTAVAASCSSPPGTP